MPDPVPSVPEDLVQVATRALDEWPWRTGSLTISTGMLARAVLEAVSEGGWVRADADADAEFLDLVARHADASRERDEARAQAAALAEALELLRDSTGHCIAAGRVSHPQMIENADAALRAFRESQEPDHAA